MKKIISLFLSLAMFLSITAGLNLTANAENYYNYEYSINGDNTVTITDYNGSATNLDIPSNINGKSVTSIGSYAFDHCTSLTSVTIPNSVTSIGKYAFYYCTRLKSVTIGNSVTSIGDYAFFYCISLTSVTIPNSVMNIGEYAFSQCTRLTSVTIGNSVTSIGDDAFERCTSLTSVTIPNSVTSIGKSAFSYCESLTSITIPDGVTSIGDYAFFYCTSLTSVTIPNSVTSIGDDAFEHCTSLASITIPDSVTSIGSYAFENCESLKAVNYNGTIAKWKSIKGYSNVSKIIKCTDGVIGNQNKVIIGGIEYTLFTDYTYVSRYVDAPEEIIIPKSINYDGFNLKVNRINSSAFYNCTSLTSVTIPNSVTSIGDSAFKGCTSLTSMTIPNSITSIGSSSFEGCTSLTSVTIPNSVTSIGNYAFSGCTSLTSMTIPNSVTSIGTSAFKDCTILKLVNYNGTIAEWKSINGYSNVSKIVKCTDGVIGNGNTVTIDGLKYDLGEDVASVIGYTNIPETVIIPKNIEHAECSFKVVSIADNVFKNCASLTSITIPNSVTSIGNYAFYNFTRLTRITIPNRVTSIGEYAFAGCTNLTSVTIPNSVTSIGDMAFSHCTSLTSITIPNSVTNIGGGAFYNCTSLTSVTIPNSVTSIGNYAFYNCTSLTSVTIPNSVTSIGDSAFKGCTSLTSMTIPNSITSIDSSSFEGCTSLTSVTIPNSVTSIGEYVFYNCESLKAVNYNGTKAEWNSIKGYSNVSKIIKCTDGVISNGNTVTIDGLKYKLGDDVASVIGYTNIPETVTIPKNIEYAECTFKVVSIDDNAFENCTNLTSVIISNGITSIGSNAFNGCSKLKKIEIPDSVTSIGSNAFDGTAFYNTVKNWQNGVLYCGNHLISAKDDVTKITVKASTVSIANGALDNCKLLEKINVLNPNCVINCTIPKTAVIGGSEGSTAEDYAQKNNMSIDYFEECTHENTIEVTIGATCTNQGAVQTRCEDCDKLISQTFIAPLGHTMVITTPAKAPTCTKDGKQSDTVCSVCHQTLTVGTTVPALGHNYESTVVAPTCTAQGYRVYKCTRCGDTYSDNYVNATGHNFGNNSQYCLNGCGTANPNYAAPTQPSTPATQPTQAPAPTQAPTTAPTTVAPAPAEPTTVANTAAPTTATQVEQTTTKAVAKPKAAKFKKAKGSNKAIALTWAKVKGVKGYQIQVATDKKFKKNKKTVTIKKQKTTKTTVKKLKAKKKYFVRIRTYKTVNGKKVYSSWSKVKSIKTK